MRVYTVHLRREGFDPDRDIVLVKEGFSWPAFLFSVLWALWCRLWLVAVGLFVAEMILSTVLSLLDVDPVSEGTFTLACAIIVGLVANDLKRWTLARHGFVEADVVVAADAGAAEQRFYERNPQLTAELAR